MRAAALGPALLLLACAATPGDPAGLADRTMTAAELAARLPEEAAGFRRGATTGLPQGEGGRETGYRTPGRTAAGATVELYRLPGANVPAGAESPAAAEAFEQLVQDATRPLPQRRLEEAARFTLDGTLRCATTAGAYGRERVLGLLCAGGIGGGLLRLRVAMPQREPIPADARAFASAILAALRTSPAATP